MGVSSTVIPLKSSRSALPDEISDLVAQDAYHLIWASNPELFTNEEGTAKKAVAYIKRPASYIDQKKGGGSLMHWKSHTLGSAMQEALPQAALGPAQRDRQGDLGRT